MASISSISLNGGQLIVGSIKSTLQSNKMYLQSLVKNYEEFKNGKITKGQYDYARRKTIKQLEHKMGPVKHLLSRKKSHRQVLRISRRRGHMPTRNINRYLGKMRKFARASKGGGYLLAGVSLATACMDIEDAKTKQEENEIFVETFAGLATGTGLSAIAGILLIGTPVGWVAGLVLIAGSMAYGSLAGRLARNIYDKNFNKVDVVSLTGVSRICG